MEQRQAAWWSPTTLFERPSSPSEAIEWPSTPPHEALHDISWSEQHDGLSDIYTPHQLQHPPTQSHASSWQVQLPFNEHHSRAFPEGRLESEPAVYASLAPLPNDMSVQQNFGHYGHEEEHFVPTSRAMSWGSNPEEPSPVFSHPSPSLQQAPSAQLDAAGYYPGEEKVLRAQAPTSLNDIPLMTLLNEKDDVRFARSTAVVAIDRELQDAISRYFFAGKLRWFSFHISDDTLQKLLHIAHRRLRFIPSLLFPGTEQSPWPQRTPELLIAKHKARPNTMMDVESRGVLGSREFVSVWSTAREVPPGPYTERSFYGVAWIAPKDYAAADEHLKGILRLLSSTK